MTAPTNAKPRLTIRRIHARLAQILALFITVHLLGHLSVLGGADLHQRTLDAIRTVIRHPIVEPALLGGLLLQISLGLRLACGRGGSRLRAGPTRTQLQTLSGLVFAIFVLIHMGAALHLRFWVGLETNTSWPAAALATPARIAIFAPYYSAGIMALFAHLALRACTTRTTRWSLLTAGAALSATLITGFAAIDTIPQSYLNAIPL